MRIGFDAKRLFYNDTGLGVYSRLLIKGLLTDFPTHEYHLYARKPYESQYFEAFKECIIRVGRGIGWRSYGMSRDIGRDGCHLFHGLSHELPMTHSKSSCKRVVTIHDLIFKKHPTLYPWLDRKIYDLKCRYSCLHSDKIIAVSKQTRRDVMEVYQIPGHKIEVIYPPVLASDPPGPKHEEDIIRQYGLHDPYWLYVGSINQRKNLEGLLKALTICRSSLPLLVLGKGGRYEKQARQMVGDLDLTLRVRFVGHIANRDLSVFYRQARALIYPSFYEGFGIPIVEALQNRVAVITSKTSSMPEAGGPGAILIDPHEPASIAAAMDRLEGDSDLRYELITAGFQHGQNFLPKNIATQTMKLYQKVMNSH